MLLAASTQRTVGMVILAIVFIGFVVYLFFSLRGAKPEVGSEIVLAPNRRVDDVPDEVLETRRLDRSLGAALAMLTVIGVALPLYWLGEPGRQENRVAGFDRTFTSRGERLYTEGAQCVNCHGPEGVGGVVSTTLTDDSGGFIAQVNWKAPALNTVMSRYSEDEIRYVLNYGRNGVMPAWGAPGGGPLTVQQIDEIIHYLRSIQIPEDEIRAEADAGLRAGVAELLKSERPELADADAATVDAAVDDWLAEVEAVRARADQMAVDADPSIAGDDRAVRAAALELLSDGKVPGNELYWQYGHLLFDNTAGQGAFGCARCHTFGWSYDATTDGPDDVDGHPGPLLDEYVPGGGFFGPNLTNGVTRRVFDTAISHADFITEGQTIGKPYGRGGDGGNGQMPGFGPRTDDDLGVTWPGLLTDDQIDAIVAFERSL
ncbi:MAG: hypothetical protein D6683_08615 [Actinomyces sp.]|nr:MAG: hypothetical protein D6683_08615 [Actinomyces sp.]